MDTAPPREMTDCFAVFPDKTCKSAVLLLTEHGAQTVEKGRRPQKQHKFGGKNDKVPLSSPYLSKILLALTWSVFCFLRRAPLTVSTYAYRGALLAPAAFQTASERVKNRAF